MTSQETTPSPLHPLTFRSPLATALLALLLLAGCADTPPPPDIADSAPALEAAELSGALRAPVRAAGEADEPMPLRERLRHHRVPGVAIAVIDGGELRWAEGYGVLAAGGEEPVTSSTRFRVGSIARALTATLALRRAAEDAGDPDLEGPLDLDEGLLRREMLEPLEMHGTTVGRPATNVALGHSADGTPRLDDGRRDPEASELWSTAEDLAAWVVDLQKAHAGKPGRRLPRATARALLGGTATSGGDDTGDDTGNDTGDDTDAQRGLGVELEGRGHARRFLRRGGVDGYRAIVLGFVHSGHGAVVLTNGDGGDALVAEILAGLATQYDWPAYQPRLVETLETESFGTGTESATGESTDLETSVL